MAKFKGGIEEAAAMLSLLSSSEAKNLLEQIRDKDPNMALELEERMIKLEDLVHLTMAMKVTFLKEMDLETFGLALRTMDKDITNKILEGLSTGIIVDIEDGLKGKPRPLSQVQDAQDKVKDHMKKLLDSGQIVLKPDGDILV
ncbi:MAG: hypothetical protein N4A33_03920 [Bacteriovoracaceae bacterium]|jgi:flagellar motor switch protein FliG|nr:hypothetical protein [Bacteriovoracaceae bacterium]